MNRLLFFFFCMIFFAAANGQSSYVEAMKMGDDEFKRKEYRKAINFYFAAEAFDLNGTKKDEVKAKINSAFNEIEKLKDQAEAAKKQALIEKDKAEKANRESAKAKIESDSAKNRAIRSAEETKNALTRITKARDAFRLITIAIQKANTDPTIALRIAEAALNSDRDSLVLAVANQIYDNHAFYKTIIDSPFKNASRGKTTVSPDGSRILTWSSLDPFKLWNGKGELLAVLKEKADSIKCINFSTSGNLFVAGFTNGSVGVWNADGKFINRLNGGKVNSSVYCVATSSDGKTIVGGTENGSIKIWDTKADSLKEFPTHKLKVNALAISPDGEKIVTVSQDTIAPHLWNLKGDLIAELIDGDKEGINTVAFSHDGKSILTGSRDGDVRLWDSDGNPSESFGVGSSVTSVTVSSDDYYFLAGSSKGDIKLFTLIWNGNYNTKEIRNFKATPYEIQSIAFVPGGEDFITATSAGLVSKWKIEGAQTMISLLEDKFDTYSMDMSPDGTMILLSSLKYVPKILTRDGRILKQLSGHKDKVDCVMFSPDGKTILTGSADKTARLWNLEGKSITEFKGHKGPVSSITFSRDGTKILTGSTDSTIRIWNTNGTMLKEIKGFKGKILALTFSPDGTKILTGSSDGVIGTYNSNGEKLNEFKLETKPREFMRLPGNSVIESIAISPDCTNIISSITFNKDTRGQRGILGIWSSDGTKYNLLDEDSRNPTDTILAFSPDGKKFITSGSSNRHGIQLWKIDGTRMWNYWEQDQGIFSQAFSRDGKEILAITSDFVEIWNTIMTLEELLGSNLMDQLSEKQKKEFGIK